MSGTLPPTLSLCSLYCNKSWKELCLVSSIPQLPFSLKPPLVWFFFFLLLLSYPALFEVVNDSLIAKSKGQFLLALAAAFDRIDHAPLLKTLYLPTFYDSSFSWFSSQIIHLSQSPLPALLLFSSFVVWTVVGPNPLSSPLPCLHSPWWSHTISWLNEPSMSTTAKSVPPGDVCPDSSHEWGTAYSTSPCGRRRHIHLNIPQNWTPGHSSQTRSTCNLPISDGSWFLLLLTVTPPWPYRLG